jgi:hypothetical protein
MASTASARARRRPSARPAGACAADSVRARLEGAHGRSAGRSPRLCASYMSWVSRRGYLVRSLTAATRRALAAMVRAGLSAAEDGKQALSTTQRLSTS